MALSFGVTRLFGDAFGSVPLLAATLSAMPSVGNQRCLDRPSANVCVYCDDVFEIIAKIQQFDSS